MDQYRHPTVSSYEEHSVMSITALGTSLLGAAATSAALDAALKHGEFRVAYQPILGVHDRSLAAFEAFVRWEHPDRGLIPAAEFVPIAEQSGQIVALGWFVARAALRQVGQWSNQLGRPIGIHLNISAIQLIEPGFVNHLKELLASEGFDPALVTVEIACHQLAHPASLRPVITCVSDLGVRVALDDAGEDDSTFPLLESIEFDTIKVDRSIVRAVTNRDPAAGDRLQRLTTIAAEHSLITVAEGIEMAEELELMTDFGCELAQGYALGRPLIGAQADNYIRSL
jgi:EAL domain-containing protein (putative c-di-GMP-specific phosphodiesterase class I)